MRDEQAHRHAHAGEPGPHGEGQDQTGDQRTPHTEILSLIYSDPGAGAEHPDGDYTMTGGEFSLPIAVLPGYRLRVSFR